MSLGILGTKIGMTRIFDDLGNMIPITVLRVGPCYVTQIKTISVDGYNAIQLGYISNQNLKKPQLGHLQKAIDIPLKYLHEFKLDNVDDFSLGQQITASMFNDFKFATVTGKSIGKGFAGNQKRHNFSRGPMTHGSKNHRAPGSIGAGTTPGRVLPGKKMAGQLGAKKITTSNLEIINFINEENLLLVKGAVPGKPGNLISIQFLNSK
jgi:large subunit ribosomal protein L3